MKRIFQLKEYIFIQADYSTIKIFLNDILYIEGLKDYLKIHIIEKKPILTLMTLKAMEEKLPEKKFIRVHRSFIIAVSKIESIQRNRIKIAKELMHLSDIMEISTKGDMSKLARVERAATKRAQATLKAREVAQRDPTKKFEDIILKRSGMAFGEAPTKKVPTKKRAIPIRRDYQATTGGYALLSKGDVVVNAKNMSSGIGGDIGAFSDKISKGMMGAVTTATRDMAPSIPVNISIGSIEGDPEEFLRRIKPAIEQSFERMYFDKQRRR